MLYLLICTLHQLYAQVKPLKVDVFCKVYVVKICKVYVIKISIFTVMSTYLPQQLSWNVFFATLQAPKHVHSLRLLRPLRLTL